MPIASTSRRSRRRGRKAALRYCVQVLGGQRATARLLGFKSHESIGKWLRRPEGADTDYVLDLVNLVRERGGVVTCHELRPDKFPAEQPATA